MKDILTPQNILQMIIVGVLVSLIVSPLAENVSASIVNAVK